MVKGGRFLCGTGLRLPTGLVSANTTNTNKVQRARIYCGAPTIQGRNWQFAFPWLYATAGEERLPPNGGTMSWFTLFNEANDPFAFTFSGNLNLNMQPGDLIWSDPHPTFVNLPNEHLVTWNEIALGIGQRYPVGYYPCLDGQDLTTGKESATDPDPTRRLTGVMASPNTAGNAQAWGPCMASCEGWDGVTRVFLIMGDSRNFSTDDLEYQRSTRACAGAAERGLDDLASGRIPFSNLSSPGAFARKQPFDRSDGSPRRRAAVYRGGVPMFTDVYGNLGGNDTNDGNNQTLTKVWADMLDAWAEQKRFAPHATIYHEFGYPWSGNTDKTFYSTLAGQDPPASALFPDSVQAKIYERLRTRQGVPPYVVPVEVPSTRDATFQDKWPVPGVTGTVQTSVSSGRSIVVNLPRAPVTGEMLVASTGMTNGETFHINKVTGTNPYTLSVAEGITSLKAAGDPVALSWIRSGPHLGTVMAKAAAADLAALKTAKVIKTTMFD